MAETGLPLNADNWIGFFAPRGTPSAAIQRVTGALHKALAVEDVKTTLARSGMLAVQSSTPASFAAFLRQDIDRHRAIARDGQIKVD
jgi:tripartite-type tricarboxylate transporter receptor subunit TctC